MIGDDLRELLGDRIPTDHARQTLAQDMAAQAVAGREAPMVLDLGCGMGDSVDLFRNLAADVDWVGLDIPDSHEVGLRTRTDAEFHTFDGERIPFDDDAFDIVYCAQVLEHVPRPEPLIDEVARTLRPGGHLAGSTSQLEPFHSRSTFNYTPHGLTQLFERAGLEVVELRPGMDALTLIVRRGLGRPRVFERWWTRESPLNRMIDLLGRADGLGPAARNAAKLVLCGQLSFLARRA